MKLILMRHAKSSWSDSSLTDHERPLNERGRNAAPLVAEYLRGKLLVPDVVLCSTSQRTRETLKRMLKLWGNAPLTEYLPQLYLATPETILDTIASSMADHDAVRTCGRLLVLGHNPGMELLVSQLDATSHRMPTAAMAIFESSAMSDAMPFSPRDLRLVDFVTPKQISSELSD